MMQRKELTSIRNQLVIQFYSPVFFLHSNENPDPKMGLTSEDCLQMSLRSDENRSLIKTRGQLIKK